MRLKYYLRGAGVGILITTAIFTIILLFNNYGKVSDEEVITRAKAMGYVLSDEKKTIVYTGETTKVDPEPKTDETKEPVASEPVDTKSEDKKLEETKPEEVKAEETKTEEKKPADTKTDIVTSANPGSSTSITYMPFSINKGEDSEDVCRRLADLGMISDAKAFNRKLVEDGVDSKIVIGTFYINTGMTEAQLEDILSSSKNRKTSLN